jgi:hypothetical protein
LTSLMPGASTAVHNILIDKGLHLPSSAKSLTLMELIHE